MQTLNRGMWDLVLWPGIELWPPALGVRSLSSWTAREVTTWNLTSPQILFTSVLCPHAEGDGWVGVKAGTVKWVFCLLNFTLRGGLFKSSFLNRCLLTWLKNNIIKRHSVKNIQPPVLFSYLPPSPPNRKLLFLASFVSFWSFPMCMEARTNTDSYFSPTIIKGIILCTLINLFLTYWLIGGIFHINT